MTWKANSHISLYLSVYLSRHLPFIFHSDTELPEMREPGNDAKYFTSHIQQSDFP